MFLPAVIKKEEPGRILKVETLFEPELQFTSSLLVEFEEQEEPESYEIVVTGSTMDTVEPVVEHEQIPTKSSDIYNDPFFNAYFKR